MAEEINQEFKIRGEILAASLKIEELLNRIIYNFFLPASSDKETRNTFLDLFVFNTTFGKKNEIYKAIIKTERYRKKIEEKIGNSPISMRKEKITSYNDFQKMVKNNLQEIITTRNNIAHGFDISNAFLALEEGEMVFANKTKMIKINKETIEIYSNLIKETTELLELTKGKLKG